MIAGWCCWLGSPQSCRARPSDLTLPAALAEEGCADMQIAAIAGHPLKQVNAILDKYLARTRALNVAATKKLEQTWIAKIRMKI